MIAVVMLPGWVSLDGASVTTREGKVYEGEVFLEAGNVVSVTMADSTRRVIGLTNVRVATFTSPQLSMAQFSPIAVGWTNADIGEVSIAGVAGQSNRLFAIQVASADIGGRADSLHFVYFRARDEADVTARVVSIGGADRLARAGVMIRDSLKADAKFAFAGVNAAGDVSLQYRTSTGEKAVGDRLKPELQTGVAALPRWLKISRREKGVLVYRSSDGKQWEQFGGGPLSVRGDGYYAGLAVTSHSGFSFCTALIDGVSRTVPGVCGEYFGDSEFSKLVTNRLDGMINFMWVGEPPAEGLRFNNFSVRWTGELEPKYSEPYIFYYDAQDAQLWVNGQQVPQIPLRRETPQPKPNTPVPLLLKAGNRYSFRFEYRNTPWRREPVRVGWSSLSQGKEPLPGNRLFCTLEAQAQQGRRLVPSSWVMGRGIMLRNGSFIAGNVRSMDEAGVKFECALLTSGVTVPLHQVARVVFRVSPRNAVLSQTGLPEGALLGNGDFIEGQVQVASGQSVKVSSVLLGLRSFDFDSGELAALVLDDPTSSPLLTSGVTLRLADNSVIVAKSVNVEQHEVTVVEPIVGELRMRREFVTELRGGAR